jgi:hypothetical protein
MLGHWQIQVDILTFILTMKDAQPYQGFPCSIPILDLLLQRGGWEAAQTFYEADREKEGMGGMSCVFASGEPRSRRRGNGFPTSACVQ